MGTIYYVCKSCEEHNPEAACFPRDMVRVASDGEWVCETCFDDAPPWTYTLKPADEPDDYPRWSSLPEVPAHLPANP